MKEISKPERESIIKKAINILIENGTKREYAEEQFGCLKNDIVLEEAEKIINDPEYAKGVARDLNFINKGE